MYQTLPVDDLGLDFRDLDTRAQRVAIFAELRRIKLMLEGHVSESRREAQEQVDATNTLIGVSRNMATRLLGMVADRDVTIKAQADEIAALKGIQAEDLETAKILDDSQKQMQAVADEFSKVGVTVDVPPPPADTPPSDGTEPPPAQ